MSDLKRFLDWCICGGSISAILCVSIVAISLVSGCCTSYQSMSYEERSASKAMRYLEINWNDGYRSERGWRGSRTLWYAALQILNSKMQSGEFFEVPRGKKMFPEERAEIEVAKMKSFLVNTLVYCPYGKEHVIKEVDGVFSFYSGNSPQIFIMELTKLVK